MKHKHKWLNKILQTHFFTKERHIDGSFVKLITLFENTPGICQTYCFPFFSVIAIFDSVFVFCGEFNGSSFSC